MLNIRLIIKNRKDKSTQDVSVAEVKVPAEAFLVYLKGLKEIAQNFTGNNFALFFKTGSMFAEGGI